MKKLWHGNSINMPSANCQRQQVMSNLSADSKCYDKFNCASALLANRQVTVWCNSQTI